MTMTVMDDNGADNEEALAGLIEAVAVRYRKQLSEPTRSKSEVRIDIIRKLKLISDAIKGLMRARQIPIDTLRQETPSKELEIDTQANEAKG